MDLLPAMEVDMHAYVFIFLRDSMSQVSSRQV
jgi:hypothetical protein